VGSERRREKKIENEHSNSRFELYVQARFKFLSQNPLIHLPSSKEELREAG